MGQADSESGGELAFEGVQDEDYLYSFSTGFKLLSQYLISIMIFSFSVQVKLYWNINRIFVCIFFLLGCLKRSS